MPGIFDGLRVLDLRAVLSGPSLTQQLAEMGAEVIKVELHPAGDVSRYLPWVRNGRSGYFVQQNRGKKSLFVDGRSEAGRALLLELVDQADVLVENFSPGAIDRLGLGWDVVSVRNPRLVMCSISAFGQRGPMATLPGYDLVAQAYSGAMHMVGDRDGPPAMTGFSPGDVLTGAHGLAGVCAALYHRERTGLGQKVEVSLINSYASCQEINYEAASASAGEFSPRRNGPAHPLIGGTCVFAVADGYVVVAAVNDRQWAALCEAIGRPECAIDPRFATSDGRTANTDLCNQVVADWLATQTSRDEVVVYLTAARVPVAPVLSIEEVITNPDLRAQGALRTVVDELMGPVDVPGVPIRFSAFPDPRDLVASPQGAHNEDIVRNVLGRSADDYAELVAQGVLRENPAV